MFSQRTCGSSLAALVLTLAVAVATQWSAPLAGHALAAPSTAQAAADRTRANAAVSRYERALARLETTRKKVRRTTADLDRVVAQQQAAQTRLALRVRAIYMNGSDELISLLLGSRSVYELSTRWEFLMIVAKRDAAYVRKLKNLRARTRASARALLVMQVTEAQAVEDLAKEVAAARCRLASSEAALSIYRARLAKVRQAAAARRKVARRAPEPAAREPVAPEPDATQQLRGSGEWKSAVASMYGLNFSGRGASGERIGPYSMIVAHKTLPFGTLIEFEYNGRRAVARVADRGPYHGNREFDLGPGVARVLDFAGVTTVRYRIIGR